MRPYRRRCRAWCSSYSRRILRSATAVPLEFLETSTTAAANIGRRERSPFRLGSRDLSTRLQISSRLYGRDAELAKLLAAYEEVRRGTTERALVLVHGYSGIGKTSLISELQAPLIRDHGYFISGKYDQLRG